MKLTSGVHSLMMVSDCCRHLGNDCLIVPNYCLPAVLMVPNCYPPGDGPQILSACCADGP
jgi:hypothetical protein